MISLPSFNRNKMKVFILVAVVVLSVKGIALDPSCNCALELDFDSKPVANGDPFGFLQQLLRIKEMLYKKMEESEEAFTGVDLLHGFELFEKKVAHFVADPSKALFKEIKKDMKSSPIIPVIRSINPRNYPEMLNILHEMLEKMKTEKAVIKELSSPTIKCTVIHTDADYSLKFLIDGKNPTDHPDAFWSGQMIRKEYKVDPVTGNLITVIKMDVEKITELQSEAVIKCVSKKLYRQKYQMIKVLPMKRKCEAGYFMGKGQCHKCPEGTFSCFGSVKCSHCPFGLTSEAGAAALEDCYPIKCKAGQYLDKTGKCEKCEEGSVSKEGDNKCLVCPKKFDSNADRSTCIRVACNPGRFLTKKRTCRDCPLNMYSDDGMGPCRPCPQGHHAPTRSTVCIPDPCKGGYYMDALVGCKQCPANTFSKDGAAACEPCPDGQQSDPGSTSCQIKNCKGGYFLAQTSHNCEECPADTFSDYGAKDCTPCTPDMTSKPGSTTCSYRVCKAGHHLTKEGCKECGENTYSLVGASECTQCPDGKTSAKASTSIKACTWLPCYAGYHLDQTLGCVLCKAGTWSADKADTCTPCPNGKTSEAGSTSADDCQWEDCEKGSYLDGSNGCKLCPKGTYGNAPGLTKCLDCPAGRVSKLGSTRLRHCTACDAGSIAKAGSCETCPADTFSTGNGDSTCHKCPKGKTCPAGSTKKKDCVWKCKGGYKLTDKGDCEMCPVNTFSRGKNNRRCTPCPTGKVVAAGKGTRKLDCKGCGAGSYVTKEGVCELCPAGTFSRTGAAHACTKCPKAKTSKAGATRKAQCSWACKGGEIYQDDGSCKQCPANTYSGPRSSTRCIKCPGGKVSLPGTRRKKDCKRALLNINL